METINETCRCGAEIRVPAAYRSSLDPFRERHAVCLTASTEPNEMTYRHQALLLKLVETTELQTERYKRIEERMDLTDQCMVDHINADERHTTPA